MRAAFRTPLQFRPFTLTLLLAPALLLGACSKSSPAESVPAPVIRPLPTAALQAVFDRSCKACHTNPASGAPQAGDRKAWAPRIAEGQDTLLDHAINGYKGMPPLGNCMDCKEDQFTALIEYMSGTTFPPH